MAKASFRIKFTPLIQDCPKNESKCCLEIVPEVSCIQNMDRLEWHEKSDFIEYTIPMTYKIILRKRQHREETKTDLEKVYHSCVDLLPTSPSFNIGCGDMMRIISDTYICYDSFRSELDIVTKLPENKTKDLTPAINSKENLETVVQDLEPVTVDESIDEVSTISITNVSVTNVSLTNVSVTNNSIAKVDASTSQSSLKCISSSIDNDSSDKVNMSSSKLQLCKESFTDSDEVSTKISTDSNKANSLRKLSVTPIFSIDTLDNPSYNGFQFLSDPLICHVLKTETTNISLNKAICDFLLDKKIEEIADNEFIDNENNHTYIAPNPLFLGHKRQLPEVRVANFIKKMENEILPLKLMLHDILQKCSNMGLIKNKPVLSKEINTKRMLTYCKSEKQSKCNRVVYSVVFDS